MAKARSARGGRTGKKTAKRSKAVKRTAKRPAKRLAARAKAKARKRPARRGGAGKASARRTPGRKAAARKAATRKTGARKTGARKAPARKAATRKASARTASTRKAPAPKPAPRIAAARATAKPVVRKPLPRNAATAKANAEAAKKVPALNRERRRLAESDEELMPSAPSTLTYASGSSAARSGSSELRDSLAKHTETGPALTGGDVDASWGDAYAVGDEAPGGDNPTPDQDVVDEIGKALGVQYDDNEELKGAAKIEERDRHRWELDPASSDDYIDRRKEED